MAQPVEATWTLTTLPRLDVACPRTLAELLTAVGEGRQPLAGGTDLLVKGIQQGGRLRPLVWVGGVDGLGEIERLAALFRLGAGVTYNKLAYHPAVGGEAPAVAEAADLVGSVQIRNVATIAGNLCNASPAADMIPPLVVHGGRVLVRSAGGGSRSVPVAAFASGPGATVLGPSELVTGIEFDTLDRRAGSAYRRFTIRKSMDLAFVGVAVRLTLEEDLTTVASATIALGAVGPTVEVAEDAGRLLAGNVPTPEVLGAAGRAAAAACHPISDLRASADYRRRLAEVMVGDVTALACERARRRAREAL